MTTTKEQSPKLWEIFQMIKAYDSEAMIQPKFDPNIRINGYWVSKLDNKFGVDCTQNGFTRNLTEEEIDKIYEIITRK